MCNGYNHRSDCKCGFGPPYTVLGRIILRESRTWDEIVISNERPLNEVLREVGFEPQEIEKTLADYEDASARRVDLRSLLMRFLGRYTYQEGISKVFFKEIPIFKLHLPEQEMGNELHKAPGSKITFKENITIVQKPALSFKIFGIGMGRTHTLDIRYSVEDVAENDECKIIYIKIPIRITRVTMIAGNKPIKDILRAEVDSSAFKFPFHNVSKTCEEKECKDDLKLAKDPIDCFMLAGCNRGYVHRYGWSQTCGITNEIKIGFKAFGFEVSIPVQIQRSRQQSLQYELPCGNNYLSFSLRGIDGITWKLFDNDSQVADYLETLDANSRNIIDGERPKSVCL